jgi:hypothetical protein
MPGNGSKLAVWSVMAFATSRMACWPLVTLQRLHNALPSQWYNGRLAGAV